jgi:hypothetical protein
LLQLRPFTGVGCNKTHPLCDNTGQNTALWRQ